MQKSIFDDIKLYDKLSRLIEGESNLKPSISEFIKLLSDLQNFEDLINNSITHFSGLESKDEESSVTFFNSYFKDLESFILITSNLEHHIEESKEDLKPLKIGEEIFETMIEINKLIQKWIKKIFEDYLQTFYTQNSHQK